MNIELPAPSNEQFAGPTGSGEANGFNRTAEQSRFNQTVENKSTERPASQELGVTSSGSGDPTSVTQTAASTTTFTSQSVAVSAAPSLDDVPVVAADEDLIEKQWVESVKKVVRENRNDPYGQSAAISRLQADYLQKRYGKTVGQAGA